MNAVESALCQTPDSKIKCHKNDASLKALEGAILSLFVRINKITKSHSLAMNTHSHLDCYCKKFVVLITPTQVDTLAYGKERNIMPTKMTVTKEKQGFGTVSSTNKEG